ncbi:amino acid ABC transporter permease [Brevibacterium otitidis]|uniref:Amino acid ABC transporter permease n=1 Tax=Brevibacterium otitidis TaxID=53364 RepID=A0ABV5X3L6_9MICO
MTDTSQQLDISNAYKKKHPWQIVGAVVALILAGQVVYLLFTTPNFGWNVVATYLFEKSIMRGLGMTLLLTVIAMMIGIILGVILALCRMSDNPVLKPLAAFYIWFFRGTPTLIQLIFFYNLSALFPVLAIGVPFGGPTFAEAPTNRIVTGFLAAILCLGLNEAALMAEIIRGGLMSVKRGQREAAAAIGMAPFHAFRRIVLPQAMRFIIPPTGNQVISMVKSTALVSVIALADLLYSAQAIYNRTFETIPLLIVACIWYLLVTSILNVGQHFIERHYGKSDQPAGSTSYRTRLARVFTKQKEATERG